MSDDKEDQREWLKVFRPCAGCGRTFSYKFKDMDVQCPFCGWKQVVERKEEQDED